MTSALKLVRATDYVHVPPLLSHHPAQVDDGAKAALVRGLLTGEERLRKTSEDAPIGIGLFDLDGRWLQVNQELCAIVGYSEREMLEVTFQDLTHPDDIAADLKNVHEMLAGEIRCYQLEQRCLHKDGRVLRIKLSVALVRDASGEPWHFVAQIEDITAAKRGR